MCLKNEEFRLPGVEKHEEQLMGVERSAAWESQALGDGKETVHNVTSGGRC